jgi:hypothetical protein
MCRADAARAAALDAAALGTGASLPRRKNANWRAAARGAQTAAAKTAPTEAYLHHRLPVCATSGR